MGSLATSPPAFAPCLGLHIPLCFLVSSPDCLAFSSKERRALVSREQPSCFYAVAPGSILAALGLCCC